jgi:NAD-dependent dihydropyrimidine dehydrogenase PreA subunit
MLEFKHTFLLDYSTLSSLSQVSSVYNLSTFGGNIMIRRIIEINEDKCNGCGACAKACHEGAIAIVDGKAKLMRDDYCDGLGDCLPTCPTGAISFVEREAAAYDEAAVLAAKAKKEHALPCGCPGSAAKAIEHKEVQATFAQQTSQLRQWPVQIKLAPVNAPWFNGAKLLVAADCTAYAYANFHQDFIKDHITLVGCPKLDAVDYSTKLTEIISLNDIRSVTVVRMEVPCCGSIEMAVKKALQASGKFIPWNVVTISTDGKILDRI